MMVSRSGYNSTFITSRSEVFYLLFVTIIYGSLLLLKSCLSRLPSQRLSYHRLANFTGTWNWASLADMPLRYASIYLANFAVIQYFQHP